MRDLRRDAASAIVLEVQSSSVPAVQRVAVARRKRALKRRIWRDRRLGEFITVAFDVRGGGAGRGAVHLGVSFACRWLEPRWASAEWKRHI